MPPWAYSLCKEIVMAIQESVKKSQKTNLKYLRDKDREMVSGMFQYHELPGGTLKFRTKFYEEDPLEVWTLTDRKIHKIPLGVAKHLRKNGCIPQHAFVLDDEGKPIQKITSNYKRYDFVSTDFMDIDEPVQSKIATVENVILKPM